MVRAWRRGARQRRRMWCSVNVYGFSGAHESEKPARVHRRPMTPVSGPGAVSALSVADLMARNESMRAISAGLLRRAAGAVIADHGGCLRDCGRQAGLFGGICNTCFGPTSPARQLPRGPVRVNKDPSSKDAKLWTPLALAYRGMRRALFIGPRGRLPRELRSATRALQCLCGADFRGDRDATALVLHMTRCAAAKAAELRTLMRSRGEA